MTRRNFTKLGAAAAGAAAAPVLMGSQMAAGAAASPTPAPAAPDDRLQSEFLLDITFDKGAPNNVGSVSGSRVVVPVPGGTFEGPRLKGVIVGPSGDWITVRPDGSSVLDLRMVLQTDDAQKIYMASRGIAYAQPGGALFARIVPVFETGAAKYLWLNNVVAVGVFRPMPEKLAYRVYRIL